MLNRFLLFVVAGFFGSLFLRMHLPIPYLLGGMVVALLCKAFARNAAVSWPQSWRNIGLMVAGYGIGATFNNETWHNLIDEAAGVIEANLIAIAVSILLAWLMARWTRTNLQSCVMGMMPGGITLMMLLTEQDKRTDPNVVMVMQVIRLIGVIIAVPFLVITLLDAHVVSDAVSMPNHGGIHWLVLIPLAVLGSYLAKKLHLPTPIFLGTILLTAIFSVAAGDLQPVPGWLMAPAQISIGLYMGLLLDAERIARTKSILSLTIIGTMILVAVSVVVAHILSARYGFSLVTAFLAMAPGGIAEMALAGMSMGENVSIILTYQLVRVLVINIGVPPLLNWYFRRK